MSQTAVISSVDGDQCFPAHGVLGDELLDVRAQETSRAETRRRGGTRGGSGTARQVSLPPVQLLFVADSSHALARTHRQPTSITLASEVPSLSSGATSASSTTLAGLSSDHYLTPTPSTVYTTYMASQQTLDHFGSRSDQDHLYAQAKARPDVRPRPTRQSSAASISAGQPSDTPGDPGDPVMQQSSDVDEVPRAVSTWAKRMDRLAPLCAARPAVVPADKQNLKDDGLSRLLALRVRQHSALLPLLD